MESNCQNNYYRRTGPSGTVYPVLMFTFEGFVHAVLMCTIKKISFTILNK